MLEWIVALTARRKSDVKYEINSIDYTKLKVYYKRAYYFWEIFEGRLMRVY